MNLKIKVFSLLLILVSLFGCADEKMYTYWKIESDDEAWYVRAELHGLFKMRVHPWRHKGDAVIFEDLNGVHRRVTGDIEISIVCSECSSSWGVDE